MRWGRWLAGGGALLLVAAAVLYFTVLPGALASGWKDDARPEYARAERAMRDVYVTFDRATFGTNIRELRRAKTPERYLAVLSRLATASRERLDFVRFRSTDAENALADLARGKARDVPSPPAIGGSGDLSKAERIAASELRYARRARAFLADYRRLALYAKALVGFTARAGNALVHGFTQVPDAPTEPAQVTRPFDRTAAALARESRVFARRETPDGMRLPRRLSLEIVRFYGARLGAAADAIRARDVATAQAELRRFIAGAKRYSKASDPTIRRLLGDSTYSRRIDRLRRMETRIADRFGEL
ncbi:MAG TPA: hypothetical protein VJT75_18440 [Thermoleophilaceae bacterium]|nr:hypothetical protein [Thermoleophilaceae bacterium]